MQISQKILNLMFCGILYTIQNNNKKYGRYENEYVQKVGSMD